MSFLTMRASIRDRLLASQIKLTRLSFGVLDSLMFILDVLVCVLVGVLFPVFVGAIAAVLRGWSRQERTLQRLISTDENVSCSI